jgi:FkbH-like protein
VTNLHWLPTISEWRSRVRNLASHPTPWDEAVCLANTRLDFLETDTLDAYLRQAVPSPSDGLATKPVRLAILGSCTLVHLHAGIRVAGLRRQIWIETYENKFGQYLQELSDPSSGLYKFHPTAVLLAFDAHHVCAGLSAAVDNTSVAIAFDEVREQILKTWRLAREAFHCRILQHTILPVYPTLLGSNEHRLPGSRATFIAQLNHELRIMADSEGVDLVALDARAAIDGIGRWHDPALWHRSKQEIAPGAAPLHGELIGRLLAAHQGRSYKCLVLDLDNTVWGGVVGDDGPEGIVVGQGSPLGEAYGAFQEYVRELSRRGVILAVCSKNDEATALEPFDKHPEMVLKRTDIACFMANWSDKPSNLRAIAEQLNIGLDAMVFVDDNPFERNLVRQELPMIAVPELPDDPTYYAAAIADGGYFESVAISDEDWERTRQYQGNLARQTLKASVTDLDSYLRGLEMRLIWRRFDDVGLQRIVQLINKSNQFNLTSRRYTNEEVVAVMNDPRAFGLQLRLVDRFGDNGIIAIVIGRLADEETLFIDTWLMSCRVLGRQLEPATLNLITAEAERLGARRLIGEYIRTKKNGMVEQHYAKLGFTQLTCDDAGGNRNALELEDYTPGNTYIQVIEG